MPQASSPYTKYLPSLSRAIFSEKMTTSESGRTLGVSEREHPLVLSLQRLCKAHEREKARTALETLLRLVDNVIKYPDEEKYRKVRTGNKRFHLDVWSLPEAQQFLFDWGWMEVEDSLVLLSDEDVQLIKQILVKTLSSLTISKPKRSEPKTEKERLVEDERRKHLEKMKRDKEEKDRILAEFRSDRDNIKDRQARESRARPTQFGGKITKFKDIGVDLDTGGG